MLSRRTFCLSSVAAAVTPAVVKTDAPAIPAVRPKHEEPGSTVYLQDLFGSSCYISLHISEPRGNALKDTPAYRNYNSICLDDTPFAVRDGKVVNAQEIRFPESAGPFRHSSLSYFAISTTGGAVVLKGPLDTPLMPLEKVTPCFSEGSIELVPNVG